MKAIAIYHPTIDYLEKEGKEYRDSYLCLAKRLIKKGIETFLVSGYLGKGKFSEGLRFGSSGKDYEKVKNIKVDLIFNHGAKIGSLKKEKGFVIINDPELDAICKNKWLAYSTFQDISPKTFLIKNKRILKNSLKNINGDIVVYKPLYGDNSQDVYIVKKSILNPDILVYPGIMQELIDSSKGIPGICKSRSDLRLFIVNGKIKFSYVCMLKNNNYIVNGENAERKEVPVEKLSKEILSLFEKVEKKFSKYKHRIYSIDLGYGKNGPKIIEINSRPAIGKKSQTWYKKSIDVIEYSIISSLS